VTKIALATTASVVGYDRNVRLALNRQETKFVVSPSKKGLRQLYQFAGLFAENASMALSQTIPQMKLIDKHLWEVGDKIEKEKAS
jgi:hypothetical protein